MDIRRVVQLWASKPDGTYLVGSGYLLTDSLVMTAAHVLGPLTPGPSEGVLKTTDVLVQCHAAIPVQAIPASSALPLSGDIALLVTDYPFDHLMGPDPRRGMLGPAVVVLPALIVGYPEFGVQQPAEVPTAWGLESADARGEPYRRDMQLSGEVNSATGFRDSTITIRLTPGDLPQSAAKRSGGSVFGGLSGAAVFIDDHLVGVVTRDSEPDRPGVLIGQRLDPAVRDRPLLPAGSVLPTLECAALDLPADDVTVSPGARAMREAYLWQARTVLEGIPDGRLHGRGVEIERMISFCANPDARYLVWHASEWSGKSALLATFVAEPPAGVDVVAFFINKNDAGARTVREYLASLIGQLEAYLDEPSEAVPGASEGRYRDLLERATATAHDNGRHLVLVVDALDEDEAFGPQAFTSIPIAALLPMNVPYLHVIASSRPNEQVRAATPAHHPFRRTDPVPLSKSPYASDIRDEAFRELHLAASGSDSISHSILAFLHAAEGDLAPAEIAELMSHLPNVVPVTPAAIRTRLQRDLRRTVRRRVGAESHAVPGAAVTSGERYEWTHATLPGAVMEELGAALIESHTRALHRWAEEYREGGWGNSTPDYLESGYPRLLASNGDTARLTDYALDRARHRWLSSRRGGHDQALTEIQLASEALVRPVPPDIGMLVRLAYERDRLQQSYEGLPVEIPATWARLGNLHRAEVLAYSMRTESRLVTLTWIAEALAVAGSFEDAERVTDAIADKDYLRARALARVVHALATASRFGDAVRVASKAARVAATITPEISRVRALCDVVVALAGSLDKNESLADEAKRLANEAERLAGTISNSQEAEALADAVEAWAAVGSFDDAKRLAEEAERAARAITIDDRWRTAALIRLVQALSAAGCLGDAERVAGTIDESRRAEALGHVVEALAAAGSFGEAKRLAADAERLAHAITDEYWQAEMLTNVAKAYAAAGSFDDAERVAGATTIETYTKMHALIRLVQGLGAAGCLGDAERVAGAITDERTRVGAMVQLARAFAAAGRLDDAERVAGTIADEGLRMRALASGVQAFATAGRFDAVKRLVGEAERFAGTIIDESLRAFALAPVAETLAAVGSFDAAERLAIEVERLVGKAERVTGVVTGDSLRMLTLGEIADALAAAGRFGEAERVAEAITDEFSRVRALTKVTQTLAAAGSLDEAARVAGKTERIAHTITYENLRVQAMVRVAQALAAAGSLGEAARVANEAEGIADSITDESSRMRALADVVEALAAVGSLDEAERIAEAVTDDSLRAKALTDVVEALTGAGRYRRAERVVRRIERIAESINYNEISHAHTLARIAQVLATGGILGAAERVAGAAEYVARAIADRSSRFHALARVAQALAAAGDLGEAERVAGEAERVADSITDESARLRSLVELARFLATAGFLDQAERLALKVENVARAIIDEGSRVYLLSTVVEALTAAGSLDEAERLAHEIEPNVCQMLLTDDWHVAIKPLLERARAANPASSWLTPEFVDRLIAS